MDRIDAGRRRTRVHHTTMAEIDLPESALMSSLERALKTHEGIENLEKSEAIYYIAAQLEGDVPDEHPDDHNGNVTKDRIKRWAAIVAESNREADDSEADE